MALARTAAGKRQQRQRVVHLAAGHHQVAHELVGVLANHSQPFHVAQNLAGQIGMLPQLQRLRFLGVIEQHHLAGGLGQLLLRVGFQLRNQPVHVGFNDVRRLAEQPGRFADEHPP